MRLPASEWPEDLRADVRRARQLWKRDENEAAATLAEYLAAEARRRGLNRAAFRADLLRVRALRDAKRGGSSVLDRLLAGDVPPDLRADALHVRAILAYRNGSRTAGDRALREAIELASGAGGPSPLRLVETVLGRPPMRRVPIDSGERQLEIRAARDLDSALARIEAAALGDRPELASACVVSRILLDLEMGFRPATFRRMTRLLESGCFRPRAGIVINEAAEAALMHLAGRDAFALLERWLRLLPSGASLTKRASLGYLLVAGCQCDRRTSILKYLRALARPWPVAHGDNAEALDVTARLAAANGLVAAGMDLQAERHLAMLDRENNTIVQMLVAYQRCQLALRRGDGTGRALLDRLLTSDKLLPIHRAELLLDLFFDLCAEGRIPEARRTLHESRYWIPANGPQRDRLDAAASYLEFLRVDLRSPSERRKLARRMTALLRRLRGPPGLSVLEDALHLRDSLGGKVPPTLEREIDRAISRLTPGTVTATLLDRLLPTDDPDILASASETFEIMWAEGRSPQALVFASDLARSLRRNRQVGRAIHVLRRATAEAERQRGTHLRTSKRLAHGAANADLHRVFQTCLLDGRRRAEALFAAENVLGRTGLERLVHSKLSPARRRAVRAVVDGAVAADDALLLLESQREVASASGMWSPRLERDLRTARTRADDVYAALERHLQATVLGASVKSAAPHPALRQGELALSIVEGDRELVAHVIHASGRHDVKRIRATENEYGGLVRELSAAGMEGAARRARNALHALSCLLEPALSAALRANPIRIHIVPSGALVEVPFAALKFDGAFLAERVQLSVSPSLAAIGGESSAVDATGPALALIDPGGDLAYARSERRLIETALPLASIVAGTDATREAASSACGLLYFACHGVVRPERPLLSGLQLAGGNRLTTADALSRGAPAHIVLLHGCHTAAVSRVDGSEWLGFVEAWLASGTRAAVGAGWVVPDGVATAFSEVLLPSLSRRDEIGDAFHRAQRALRLAGLDVLDWAAFRLYGDPAARVSIAAT